MTDFPISNAAIDLVSVEAMIGGSLKQPVVFTTQTSWMASL